MSRWAGRILVVMGVGHLVVLGVQNAEYLDEWFGGALWGLPRGEFVHPGGANGAFWIVIGSFAVPLLLLGLLVDHLARRGVAVPQSVGWGLAAWCLVGSTILQPTPLLLGLVPALLLIRSTRRTAG
ncbi:MULTISPECIES: DUF6463 family protein [unclassified Streptomyces]|uniref:DUF6463 family protein n=1 Tax=unclassified Streptomyces TaxID=2593676 RepID=UPI0005F91F7D|nr:MULTISPECIES: DUF6463 family protein [unclassified Streptomyces]KJY30292.1 hypothetical protein VR45_27935 [Streptomyces sp. NRRL S-495]KOV34994.1 hypothetical protein ADK60_10600 [Streptomyces sp. XY431]